MKKLFILLGISFLASCSGTDFSKASEYNFKKAKTGSFGMDVYKDLTETSDLNEIAVMQYQNLRSELYLLVIEESKQEYLDALASIGENIEGVSVAEKYRQSQMQNTSNSITVKSTGKPEHLKIDGLDAYMQEMSGRYPSVDADVAFFFGFIEGGENMYMIMTWTMDSKKDKYRDMFNHSIRSFKLLKK